MSSQPSGLNSKLATIPSKTSASGASSQVSPAASQAQQFFSNDSAARRSGSNSGTASSGARAAPAPRNSQSSKAKHKQGKRFRPLDEDAEAEAFSMQNPHGRRGQQSITHLMQFALPPRPTENQFHRHSYNGSRRNGRVNPTWGLGSGYHAVDKARYVHANYRFIVDPRGDYRAQAEDADVYLDWSNVLQIIASSKTQAASCPICLGEPTAPRMAKCGHIFCLPCLIRYMHSEDAHGPPPEKKARWKKCPICWDSVYVSETRPVRWYIGQESDAPREGGDVVLRLVKRKPGSTLAMPRESADNLAQGDDIPWHFAAEVMDYARVMKGTEDYMMQQHDAALAAVEQQEKEDELIFGEDTEWTRRAMRMLTEAKEKTRGMGNPPAQPAKPTAHEAEIPPDRARIEFNETDEGVPDMYLQQHAEVPVARSAEHGDATPDRAAAAPTDGSEIPRTLTEMRQRHTDPPAPGEYLFYHGLQHYYLSPLDIRILRTAFGSYQAFPSSILPRVERVSSGHVVDDDLRKRIKYLAHLPHGCEVSFLECDWRDVVPAAVLAEFGAVLARRRRRNEDKAAREEKERVRIEKAEERELAAVRQQRRRPSLPDAFFSSTPPPPSLLAADASSTSSPPGAALAPRPGFASLASPSTSPTVPRTVWGTAAGAPSRPLVLAALPRDERPREDDDGWLQGWETDLLDLRLEQQHPPVTGGCEGLVDLHAAHSGSGSRTSGAGGVGGGKKGKKSKKITLMSTATARRGA